VNASGGQLLFTQDFAPTSSGTNYFIRVTADNLVAGDTTTFSLSTTDIDEVEGGVVESGSTTNAVHTQDSAPSGGVIYYSVGTDSTALYSGNASASAGTLTLSSAAVDKIGVGDEVRVGANRYYITGRSSSTVFTIQNSAANGGTPGDTNITFGSTAIEIFRAFNSLSVAEAGSSNASHLATADLVTGNFQLNWTCYNDAALNDTVIINGYTTGPSNYIHIYTPTNASQVGISQRHNGTAGTGFRMVPVTGAPSSSLFVIRINDEHVRITGIEIDGSNVTNAREISGVNVAGALTVSADIQLDKLIIHDLQSQDGAGSDADERARQPEARAIGRCHPRRPGRLCRNRSLPRAS
jgi:hypothetical protein